MNKSPRIAPCCVASSSCHVSVEKYLRRAGLYGFFRHIIGGDEVNNAKPEPDIFLKACDHFSVPPSRALVLEDSENGILAAWNAQIPVICIPDMVMPSEDLANKTVGVIKTADEVIKLFEFPVVNDHAKKG